MTEQDEIKTIWFKIKQKQKLHHHVHLTAPLHCVNTKTTENPQRPGK